MKYIDKIEQVAATDVAEVRRKDASYGGSWLRRGGIGAFMMLARKYDRMEQQGVTTFSKELWDEIERAAQVNGYDIFHAIEKDPVGEEGVLDQIRDLRRYLMLVEAEYLVRKQNP